MADTGAGGDAGKTSICQNSNVLAKAEMFQGRRDLVNLLHAGAHGTTADQHENVAGLDAVGSLGFDRGDGRSFAREDPGGTGLAIDAVGIDHARVNGGALDHRAVGGQVSARESYGRGQPAYPGLVRIHDDIVRVDSILCRQYSAQAAAALRALPPVERPAKRFARGSKATFVEQAETAQMQHNLRHSPRKENAHGRMAGRAIG